jgi:DNA-directed RNA polymerase specialized sigma24 family protein
MSGNTTAHLDHWLLRIRGGDDSAFNELLLHFERRLENLARKMLRSFPEVEAREQTGDILQESMLRLGPALRSLAARDGGPTGSTTFHTADFLRLAALQIRRELLDLVERHRRRRTDGLPDSGLPAGSTWDSVGLAEWTNFHEKAAALPEEQREVFDLLYYDGLDQREAADHLGICVRTVRTRWQKARLNLADALGGRLPGL